MQTEVTVGGGTWVRIPIRTRLILKGDSLEDAIFQGLAMSGLSTEAEDTLFVSEKAVSASQGRYHLLDSGEVKPRRLATWLSRHVTKTPAGIGLGMPETMECAIRECGAPRILFAAIVGALGKLLGRKGDFYRVAGSRARSIDGPTSGTIPPFNRAVSLAPEDPDGAARRLAERFNCRAAVVDINDLGGNILGTWPGDIDRKLLLEILSDNPLGQGTEQTPAGIVRRVST